MWTGRQRGRSGAGQVRIWMSDRPDGPLAYLILKGFKSSDRWTEYFLMQSSFGPTEGVPWDYVVPASSIVELQPVAQAVWVKAEPGGKLVEDGPIFQASVRAAANSSSSDTSNSTTAASSSGPPSLSKGWCPVPTFISTWAMLESGLPIDLDPAMNATCQVRPIVWGSKLNWPC